MLAFIHPVSMLLIRIIVHGKDCFHNQFLVNFWTSFYLQNNNLYIMIY